MKVNWKARFKNKPFVIIFATLVITFVYQLLGIFNIVPTISEDLLIKLVTMGVNILAFVGVIVDPTTEGMSDSERALTYFTENDEREDKKL